jgi:PAS domain S-box-containing protein
MKDNHKTKKQLIDELTELRSQNATLNQSTTVSVSAELLVDEARRYAESIVETVRESLLVLDADLKIVSANRNFYRTFKVTPGETIGSFIYDLGNKQWDIPKLRELLEEVLPEKEAFDDFEVAHNFQDIGHKVMRLNARQIYRKDVGVKMILLAIEDITEHKRLEDLLTESEGRYRHVFETASDGIVLFEKREGKITHANQAVEKMLGYSLEESVGKKLQDIGIVDIDDFQTLMQNLNEIGITNYTDVLIKTKSGQHIDTDIYLADRARLVQCNIRDISQRKQAEFAFRETQNLLNEVGSIARIGGWKMDLINRKATWTQGTYDIVEITPGAPIPGPDEHVDYYLPEYRPLVVEAMRALIENDKPLNFEAQLHTAKGNVKWCHAMARAIRKGGKAVEVYGTFQDITNRKRAEDALRESEANYRQLFDNAPTVIYQIDFRTGKFLKANDALCEYLGYSQQEITSLAPYDIMTKESQKLLLERLNKMAQGDKVPEDPEYEIIDKNGKRRWVQLNSKNIYDSEGLAGADVVAHDITDRKQAEDELKQSEERYRSIFENVQEGIFRATPDGRVIMSNQAMAKMFGYESSEELMAGVTDIAHQYYVNPEDRRKLKEMLEEYGFTKEYETQNYRKDGSIIWTSLAMQAVRDDKGQIMYYDGIAEDITNRKESVERIRKALGATVQAISIIVETRDPYTAGHQRRVADLARAIATEMKLSVDQIDGIRMAATIHDLGKISVPADILSKPTKLTALEFSLIKTHSQSGYDILKDIDFPWPVARTVLEHHERMNGSGYPNGLTGDNLLMESRILSVADVVESMGSHRPYRPSLGIEAALEEIEKNRGTLYDNTVADACLRLFREKGYQLEGT